MDYVNMDITNKQTWSPNIYGVDDQWDILPG